MIFDTLEHVENVHQAMREIHRVLEPGGMVILSSVMKFPIHDYPSDYWRFTPKAFELLLEPFAVCEVESDGDPQFPDGIYGFGIKEKKKPLFKKPSSRSGEDPEKTALPHLILALFTIGHKFVHFCLP